MGTHQILVVDDDFVTRETLRRRLEAAGYEVTLAEDARAALRTLDAWRPDLIVTDLTMPQVLGEVLIAFVRGRADLADIPVVVLTGFGMVFGEAARRAGATEVLEKPEGLSRVAETVTRLLGTQPKP